jgi:hypothetical protein
MKKMTSKDKTFGKMEELRTVFLIMHYVNELFICFESAFGECKQWLRIVVGINDSLHESIGFCIEDE